ncbi:uncharacterized protein METZ01_LOCUS307769 [marine metagenome]|uniref:Tripartite ATP-independent periplasmic transporters DctQ component domain-containing protein n=1 Tax=marine metagenome TaxID=408172 RepID=A0A382N3L5_9ZZZZ
MRLFESIIRFIDGLNERIGTGAAWLTTILVLVVCFDVFTRYLLKTSSVAVQELEWHIFSVIFLVASAYSLRHNRHVRVDVLYMNFTPKTKSLVNLVASMVFLMPFCIVAIWSSQNFVMNAFNIGEISPDPGGLPFRYLLKATIPFGFLLVFLQGVALACRSWLEFRNDGKWEVTGK